MKLTIRRVNISNANVFGLSKDLGLRGIEYNISLVIFFVPVSVFERSLSSEMYANNSLVCMFNMRYWPARVH